MMRRLLSAIASALLALALIGLDRLAVGWD